MSSQRSEIEQKLERFILTELLEDSHSGGDPLEVGAVDSLGLEQLVDYIEEEFGVRIDDTEMTRKNFDGVPVLSALVESKLGEVE